MKITTISKNIFYKGKPENYAVINSFISRSAQPAKEDIAWLKEQGVTDIINFRTTIAEIIDYDEEKESINQGIKYHCIPTITARPNEDKVKLFLKIADEIEEKGGKIHMHCKAGADRTGLYTFIYKTVKNIGTLAENEKEWIEKGHNIKLYPNLRNWAKDFVKNLK